MDIEQLKLVLSTLQSLGVEGKQAFIWWLAADKVLPFVMNLAWIAALCAVVLRVTRVVRETQADTRRLVQLYHQLLGRNTSGDWICSSDFQNMQTMVDKLKANQKS